MLKSLIEQNVLKTPLCDLLQGIYLSDIFVFLFTLRDVLEMERVHDEAARSPESFLGNPINAYLLVKRLTVDWLDLQNIMTDDSTGQGKYVYWNIDFNLIFSMGFTDIYI